MQALIEVAISTFFFGYIIGLKERGKGRFEAISTAFTSPTLSFLESF